MHLIPTDFSVSLTGPRTTRCGIIAKKTAVNDDEPSLSPDRTHSLAGD